MSEASVIKELGDAVRTLHRAVKATEAFVRETQRSTAARSADDDDWRPMPNGKQRCEISGKTGRTINTWHAAKKVRKKRINGSAYYSGHDVRRLISGE